MRALGLLLALCACRPVAPAPEPLAPSVSVGRLAGFRQVYVDPDGIGGALRPVEAAPHAPPVEAPPRGTLQLVNLRSVPCEVAVSDVRLGRVPGGGTATVADLAAGTYLVDWTGPDGEVRHERVQVGAP